MTVEVIRPREQLDKAEIMLLGLLAHNNTMSEIRQRLIWHKQYLGTKKELISQKMGEHETEEGVCKAIVWAVSSDRIVSSSLHGFPEKVRFEGDDLLFLAMMGRGMTKYEIASELNIDPGDAAIKRDQISKKFRFKTIYAAVAAAAFAIKQAEVRV